MPTKNLPDQAIAGSGVIRPNMGAKTKEDWIGNQLKQVYDEALSEDVPDDMLELLSALDDADDSDGNSGGEAQG
jgi:hypothetical protein